MSSYKEIIADDTAYSILDEYYFVVQADGTSSNSMAVSDDGEYIVYTAALDGEIYISFLLIEKQYYTLLLTIERVREDENWGIRTLYINDYSYYQMNAAGFYETAKVLSDKGHVITSYSIHYTKLYDLEHIDEAVVISADGASSADDGSLVILSGDVVINETLKDTVFDVTAPEQTVKMQKSVTMYQWQEISETNDNDETTYRYEKVWSGIV